MEPPQTPKRKQLTRDQRLQVQTLHTAGLEYAKISTQLGITRNQVQYAAKHRPTPQNKLSGNKRTLSSESMDILMEFVCRNRENRRYPCYQISYMLGWKDVSSLIIQHALEKQGFRRYVARCKPKISEKNRLARLLWAHKHRYWTREQWNLILWTDETWVTNKHRKIWVTRRKWEGLEDTCLVDKEARPKGWMFWGCFSGALGLGPGFFWEKA